MRLTLEVLKGARVRNHMTLFNDRVKALAFLRQAENYTNTPRPDLLPLHLNLPNKNGLEVLAEIKADQDLRIIPVLILTVSGAEVDYLKSFALHATCCFAKPINLRQFINVIRFIEDFWLIIVKMPTRENR